MPGLASLTCCRHSGPCAAGKVSIHTRVDQSGVFSVVKAGACPARCGRAGFLSSAHLRCPCIKTRLAPARPATDATVEVWEEVPPPPPPPAANTSGNSTGNATDATDGGAGNATDAKPDAKAEEAGKQEEGKKGKTDKGGKASKQEVPAPAPEEAPKLRKRVVKVALNVTGGLLAPGMNDTELTVGGLGEGLWVAAPSLWQPRMEDNVAAQSIAVRSQATTQRIVTSPHLHTPPAGVAPRHAAAACPRPGEA